MLITRERSWLYLIACFVLNSWNFDEVTNNLDTYKSPYYRRWIPHVCYLINSLLDPVLVSGTMFPQMEDI